MRPRGQPQNARHPYNVKIAAGEANGSTSLGLRFAFIGLPHGADAATKAREAFGVRGIPALSKAAGYAALQTLCVIPPRAGGEALVAVPGMDNVQSLLGGD